MTSYLRYLPRIPKKTYDRTLPQAAQTRQLFLGVHVWEETEGRAGGSDVGEMVVELP